MFIHKLALIAQAPSEAPEEVRPSVGGGMGCGGACQMQTQRGGSFCTGKLSISWAYLRAGIWFEIFR